jgi:hypothetical protein
MLSQYFESCISTRYGIAACQHAIPLEAQVPLDDYPRKTISDVVAGEGVSESSVNWASEVRSANLTLPENKTTQCGPHSFPANRVGPSIAGHN